MAFTTAQELFDDLTTNGDFTGASLDAAEVARVAAGDRQDPLRSHNAMLLVADRLSTPFPSSSQFRLREFARWRETGDFPASAFVGGLEVEAGENNNVDIYAPLAALQTYLASLTDPI